MGRTNPKIAHSRVRISTPSKIRFLGPT